MDIGDIQLVTILATLEFAVFAAVQFPNAVEETDLN